MLVPERQAAILIGDGVVKTAYEFITVLKLAKVPQTWLKYACFPPRIINVGANLIFEAVWV